MPLSKQQLGSLLWGIAGTGWRLLTGHNAGSASGGRRQANHFGPEDSIPALAEYDLWAAKN